MPASTHRDPRSIITPDAFEVAEDLIGLPLAAPGRRAVALAIDGLVIVGITALTRSFSLIVGVLAALLFMRAGFRRTPVRGSVFGRAMRFSVGCLGVFIAIVTAGLWAAFGIDFDRDGRSDGPGARVAERATQMVQGLGALEILGELQQAETREEAVDVAADAFEASAELGVPPDALRSILLEAAPDSASWASAWPSIVDSVLDAGVDSTPAPPASAAAEEVESFTDVQVVERYAEMLRARERAAEAGTDVAAGEEGEGYGLELERRAREVVAGDTLEALGRSVVALQRRAERQERDLEEAEEELDAAGDRGILRRLLDLADDLGFGFGWAALYMTVLLSWWKGQTVGKRLLGIRVVRLDGDPITWWVAFERVGGYAAGLATGLLGFAQVWWDANRQMIHDRIVGTVVVRDGADKVLDWESAL
jgi:uncharacterized RDD family membrane protein YckC